MDKHEPLLHLPNASTSSLPVHPPPSLAVAAITIDNSVALRLTRERELPGPTIPDRARLV